MSKVYLGLAGRILSGKSSAANFFVDRFHADHLRFSKLLDEILDILDLERTRINEQDMGVLLKELYGEEVLSNALVQRALKSQSGVVLFDGLRKKEEVEFLRQLPGFKFVFIKADQKIRYERMMNREEKLNENKQTFEEFQKSEQHEADKQISELENYADYVIVNEGGLAEFQDQLTRVITQSL